MSAFDSHKFHGLECLKVLEGEFTDVSIVNLKTGEVIESSAETVFSIHHINAFEIDDGSEIIVDMATNEPTFLKEYSLLKNILNPPETSDGSITMSNEIIRYTINLKTKTVTPSRFPNNIPDPNRRYENNFDLPTINENYRGQEVFYVFIELILSFNIFYIADCSIRRFNIPNYFYSSTA